MEIMEIMGIKGIKENKNKKFVIFSLLIGIILMGVSHAHGHSQEEIEVISEKYVAPVGEKYNIDSLAVWHGPDDENWILATAKDTDQIVILDATTGKKISEHGKTGSALGELDYPNGIAVKDDLLFIVERDNHRVQLFHLPEMEPILTVGADRLINPYGITVVKKWIGHYDVFVTDNYEVTDPTMKNDHRVHRFHVSDFFGHIKANWITAFGETSGDGELKDVETIYADDMRRILLIADETAKDVRVYSFEGKYLGIRLDAGGRPFEGDPEGVALYRCPAGTGYWILTEQNEVTAKNIFHVYSRENFEYLGNFRGETTNNTDGVVLTQSAFPGFRGGAFFVVHDDHSVGAFSLMKVFQKKGWPLCGVR